MRAWQEFLIRDPEVCGGELCAKRTRIPVTVILDSIAEGTSREQILVSYPALRLEHLDAALVYAARSPDPSLT
jgi:uncharacterized protein (DUF433 family)